MDAWDHTAAICSWIYNMWRGEGIARGPAYFHPVLRAEMEEEEADFARRGLALMSDKPVSNEEAERLWKELNDASRR